VSSRGRSRAHRALSALATTVMIAALLLAAAMIVPTLLGFERYVIVSGSMVPAIPVGAVVYDEVVPVDDIEIGDIITFVPPPEYGIDDPVTHRVVQITFAGKQSSHPGQRVFQTKGDANEDVDPWQMLLDGPEQARYVDHIPYVGYFYMALQMRWVQVLVIAVPAIALAVYIVVGLWRVSGSGVREQRLSEQAQAGEQPTGHRGEQGPAAQEVAP